MKVTTPSWGIKVPGPREFLSVELHCVAFEDEARDDRDAAEILAARRKLQDEDMARRMARLPELFLRALQERDAAKAALAAKPVAPPTLPAPAAPTHAPAAPAPAPDAPTKETLAALRAAALKLRHATGEDVNVAPPKTEAEARKLATDMDAEAQRLIKYPPGANVAAAQRLCSLEARHDRNSGKPVERGAIGAEQWDLTVRRYGRPCCPTCEVLVAKGVA